jgi:hypothetical protein
MESKHQKQDKYPTMAASTERRLMASSYLSGADAKSLAKVLEKYCPTELEPANPPQCGSPDLSDPIVAEDCKNFQQRYGFSIVPRPVGKNERLERLKAVLRKSDPDSTSKDDPADPCSDAFVPSDANGRRLADDLRSETCGTVLVNKKYEHEISFACIFRNEARFLKEWITFHRMVGVEHFYLFNNASSDDFFQVLEPFIRQGTVDLINWNTRDARGGDWVYIETEALNSALRLARGRSKWLAFIDTDEFLYPVHADSLPNLLKDFEQYGSLSVRYNMFGTSNVKKIGPTDLLIEKLTHSCSEDSFHNHMFKPIVRPEYVDCCENSHYCLMLSGFNSVTEDFEPLTYHSIRSVKNTKLAVNHYWTRDIAFFEEHKLPQLVNFGASKDQCLKNLIDLDEAEHKAILRWVPKLRTCMSL